MDGGLWQGREGAAMKKQPAAAAAMLAVASCLSGFTAGAELDPHAGFGVTTEADSGPGSLRQAILDANAALNGTGPDLITFDLPGSGPHVIRLADPLPVVTDPVIIDGYTQPGSSVNTLQNGWNGVVLIELDGSQAGRADGLYITSGYCTVRGLAITRFEGNGIRLEGNGDNLVEGNMIGASTLGGQVPGNAGAGVAIVNCADNAVGGTAPAGRNVIAGNEAAGVVVLGDSSSGNTLQGNLIYANQGASIDLGADGATPNDSADTDTGPNRLQNSPELTAVSTAPSGGLTIQGSISGAANTDYRVELFRTGAPCPFQGELFLAAFTVATGTTGSGAFALTLPGVVLNGDFVTATATDPGGSTSEFSRPAQAFCWLNAAGGDWSDAWNWGWDHAPGTADDVFITLDGTYEVALDRSVEVRSLTLGGDAGGQVLSTGGWSLTLDGDSVVGTNGILNMDGGQITGSGNLTVTSMLLWSDGTMAGTGVTEAAGGVDMVAGGRKTLLRPFRSYGLATLGGPKPGRQGADSTLSIGPGGSFTNLPSAEFVIQNDRGVSGQGTFTNDGGTMIRRAKKRGAAVFQPYLVNAGTVEVQKGTLVLAGGGTHTGRFTVAPSTTLQFDGVHALQTASSVSGAGTVLFRSGNVTVSGVYDVSGVTRAAGATVAFDSTCTLARLGGALVVSNGILTLDSGEALSVATMTLLNGTIKGQDTIAVSGRLTWENGVMLGPGATVAQGGIDMTLGMTKALGRVLDNAGTATLGSPKTSRAGGGTNLNIMPTGTFNNLSGAVLGIMNTQGVFGPGRINNRAGALIVRSGNRGAAMLQPYLSNEGTVDVQQGTLRLTGGGGHAGALTVAAGASLEFGGGVHDLQTTSRVSGAGTVVFQQGTVTAGGSYEVTGATSFAGADVAFAPACSIIAVGDSLSVSAGTASFDSGETVSCRRLDISGGTLTGSDEIAVTGSLSWSHGAMSGTGRTSVGGTADLIAGTSKILERALDNAGTATLGGPDPGFDGALSDLHIGPGGSFNTLAGGVFRQKGGFLRLEGGTLSSAAAVQLQAGTLLGNGSIAAGLASSGTVSPGLSAGAIQIAGNYVQGFAGTLQIEVGGTGAGTEFDQVAVTGSAALDGILKVTLINAFTPSAGDSFTILTAASRTGTFSGLDLPSLGSGRQWSVVYGPTTVVLAVN